MTIIEDRPVDADAEAAFEARVRQFLDAHCERRKSSEEDEPPPIDSESTAVVAKAKAYQAALTDAGLAFLTWPKHVGGQALSKRYVEIFNDVATSYEVPNSVYQIGHGMCAPTILEFGTEEQQRQFLPELMRGS